MKTHKLVIMLRDLANKIETFEATNALPDSEANHVMDLVYPELCQEIPELISELKNYISASKKN
jgi:hypothetical protein